jgi:hypothetical protein
LDFDDDKQNDVLSLNGAPLIEIKQLPMSGDHVLARLLEMAHDTAKQAQNTSEHHPRPVAAVCRPIPLPSPPPLARVDDNDGDLFSPSIPIFSPLQDQQPSQRRDVASPLEEQSLVELLFSEDEDQITSPLSRRYSKEEEEEVATPPSQQPQALNELEDDAIEEADDRRADEMEVRVEATLSSQTQPPLEPHSLEDVVLEDEEQAHDRRFDEKDDDDEQEINKSSKAPIAARSRGDTIQSILANASMDGAIWAPEPQHSFEDVILEDEEQVDDRRAREDDDDQEEKEGVPNMSPPLPQRSSKTIRSRSDTIQSILANASMDGAIWSAPDYSEDDASSTFIEEEGEKPPTPPPPPLSPPRQATDNATTDDDNGTSWRSILKIYASPAPKKAGVSAVEEVDGDSSFNLNDSHVSISLY